jgi:hypothetical protein
MGTINQAPFRINRYQSEHPIMKRYEQSFIAKLVGIDFYTLENSPHSIFALSEALKLIYFNKAWFNFAQSNNGEPDISLRFPLGTSIESAISGKLIKDFYIENYKEVFLSKKVWKHEYECSSPEVYRLFREDAYPLKNGEGIVVVNSLIVEKTFNDDSSEGIRSYVATNGIITQCSNCRKTQRPDELLIWDWVSTLVVRPPSNVSHSLCPVCFDYYWR